MVIIKNNYTDEQYTVGRFIGTYEGQQKGAHVLITTGLHGNEPSGVLAMIQVMEKLRDEQPPMKGKITGLCGNLQALSQQVRYLDEDMNRIFLPATARMLDSRAPNTAEEKEMAELLDIFRAIKDEGEEVFFVDCHSTSSETEPYVSLNAGYRKSYEFARGLPLTSVVGVERVLKGCLSEYLNMLDFHGFTFEAGQHEARETIACQEAMIWLALEHANCISADHPQVAIALEVLKKNVREEPRFFHVTSAHKIELGEKFEMKPGFRNLQPVKKGELLAWVNGQEEYCPADGRILMPLYQKQGNFGYFMTEEVDTEQFIQEACFLSGEVEIT
jgi:succinylglutamate desuccinylase